MSTYDNVPRSASAWVARLIAGPLSPDDDRALRRWLEAAPSRAGELRRALSVWDTAVQLKYSALARSYLEHDLAEGRHLAPRGRHRARAAVSWIATAAAIVVAITLPSELSDAPRLASSAAAQTSTGQILHFALPDRSLMTVGADSMVQVSFAEGQRDATLRRGEAFFEIQRDRRRPFIVTAGAHRVVVTGTKFNVRSLPDDAVEVAVTEGSVAVSAGESDSGRTMLRAGDVFLFPAKGIPLRRSLSAEQATAWRSGRLHFDDARLDDVLRELNRYAEKPISAESVDLTGLTLTARLTASDTESALLILKDLFKFDVAERRDRWELTAPR